MPLKIPPISPKPPPSAGPTLETLGRPVSAEDFIDPAPPPSSWLDTFKSAASSFAQTADPRPMLTVLQHAVQATPQAGMVGAGDHGLAFSEDLKAIGGAHAEQFQKALDAFKAGRYSEAAGHGAAAALPLIGPAAAHAGEQIASGDVAGGLGASAALLAPSAIGPAVGAVKAARLAPGATMAAGAVSTPLATRPRLVPPTPAEIAARRAALKPGQNAPAPVQAEIQPRLKPDPYTEYLAQREAEMAPRSPATRTPESLGLSAEDAAAWAATRDPHGAGSVAVPARSAPVVDRNALPPNTAMTDRNAYANQMRAENPNFARDVARTKAGFEAGQATRKAQAPVRMRAPDGFIKTIRAEEVPHYLALGAQRVSR